MPMTPEIAEKLNSERTPGRFIEDGQIYADTREYKDGLCESGGLVLLEERYGMFAYDGDKELFLNAPAVYDAYITQAKVVQELVGALTEFSALEVKGHSLMSRLQFSDTGRELSAKINEALKKAGRYDS